MKKDLTLKQFNSHAKSDLRVGLILLAEPLFYEERRTYTRQVDCRGATIAPGLIDIQVSYFNMALK